MGTFTIKLANGNSITVDGDSILYSEGGNVLEVLNEGEEILAAFRNWEYVIVQESEEEYQRSLLGDEDDEDLEDLEYEEEGPGEPGTDEEGVVQKAREIMARAIAENGGLPPATLTLEQFDENAAHPEPQS